jgi:uncharacterized delta-60 repeat protein
MKNFWGLGMPTLLFSARLTETAADALRARRKISGIIILAASVVFSAVSASAQDSFATAYPITGVFGSVTNDNTLSMSETGDPSIAGYAPNAPVWYAFTAPQSGVVEMDTIGSTEEGNIITIGTNVINLGFSIPLDTVMAIYTGSSLSTLTQVAANDDLYPVPESNQSYPENIYDVIPGTNAIPGPITAGPVFVGGGTYSITEYYSGPSGLRFNVVGGQTYYIAVDSKANQFTYIYGDKTYSAFGGLLPADTGPIILTWAFQPSGVFRFATENFDETGNFASTNTAVPPPLIPTCQTETSFQSGDFSDHGYTYDVNQYNIQIHSYYPYNVAGVPVTFTRVAGSSGRILLTYSTEDGDTNLILNGDQPATAGVDYTPETNQTLIFDDGEMSKTIYVPVINSGVHQNRDFTVAITGIQADPYEDTNGDAASISPPRIDSNFGQAEVRILDVGIDPKGPSDYFLITSNLVGTNLVFYTNQVWTLTPTNPVLNFAKVNYRFPRDVTNYWNSAGNGTLVTIWVTRRGTNTAAVTANWSVDNGFLADADLGSDSTFALEPASDYANPDPASLGGYAATNTDFSFSAYSGTVSFPDATSGHAWDPQPIQFLVHDNGNTTLDKDFIVDLFQVVNGAHIQMGMVAQTKVTILADRAPVTGETPADNRLPAGSVDENYNIDFGLFMAPSINTQPQNNPEPGTDGEVDGLTVLTNNETLAVGAFDSYNGVNRYGICLIQANGLLDQSFNPGSGVNVRDGYAIDCVAPAANSQFIIGGSFTSYNGQPAGGVARVNLDGSIDTSFQATVNQGSAPGTVYSVAVQPNGQVLIGGNFNEVDGQPCDYVARLNANGSLDTAFNPGATLSGPVFALATPQTAVITTNVVSTTGQQVENDATININSNDVGTVTVNFIFPTTNEMYVVYGNNVIFDTGLTATGPTTPARFSVPYGPGNAPIILVVNPGGGIPTGTNYSYSAVVTANPAMPEVLVGGNFGVQGQNYTDIALFNTNGGLDTATFSGMTLGADQPIYAMDWQPDGKILIGGNFQNFNATPISRFARLNADGSLDTTNFYVGAGADDTVFCVKYINPYSFSTYTNFFNGQTNTLVSINRSIYIGGQFSTYNGTRRLGFARLYTDGTVDTTFMDSTYNQFAGLPKVFSYDAPGVYTVGVQNDGNVMIGGSFNEVGGGEAEINPRNEIDLQEGIAESFTNQWLLLSVGETDVEPNARDGVRNRSNVARLVGGATPGPGNLLLVPDSSSGYQANRNQVIEPVSLVRTNGFLGPESANFSIIPGTAQSGSDLIFQSAEPMDYLAWQYQGPTRMHTDGLQGFSGFLYDQFNQGFSGGLIDASEVNVTIRPDANVAGNLSATYQLANPENADELYLGGEDIPVGNALGLSSSSVSLIDNSQQAGTFGFASATFIATNLSPQITVVRNNGAYGAVTLNYSTNSPYPNGGTAILNSDYPPIPSTAITFLQNQLTNQFYLSLYNGGVVYTNFTEKTINLQLSRLRPPGNGAALGISNTTVRLINPNFQGYLTLTATNYFGLEAPPYGEISFTVNRVAGSDGSLSVQYDTTDGSARNNVDYVGATNTLEWNNGDVSPRTVTLALINSGVVGTNKQFNVHLFNPQLNDSPDANLFYPGSPGSITGATMTISNNNNYGSVQFSATNYLVNENGGYATITVLRSGGVAGPAYVSYSTSNGSGLANANYFPASGTLTFAPNQLSASFEVGITNNGATTPAEFTFNVNLSNPVNLALGTLTNAQVNIINDQYYNQPPGSTNANFVTDINGDVLALGYQTNGQIIAGGSFNIVNGLTENNVVRLNSFGAVDTSFAGSANGAIQALASQTDNRVLVGGQFTSVDGTFLNYIARLMTDGTLDSSFDVGAGANGPVYSLVETFIGGVRRIYAGGAFSTMNSINSEGIARLNNNGTVDGAFNVGAGVDGTVYAIAVYPTNSAFAGDVIIGGSFAHFNGVTVNGIVRLQSNGSMDVGFNPGTAAANGVVNAIAIQPDGGVLVGGAFTNFDGQAATNITRLNGDGSTDTNFITNIAPGANSTVDGIILQPDNRILVLGQFTQFGALARSGVTRLLSTGVADPTINFGTGANGAVDAALVDPNFGLITLGGAFTAFNGAAANHIIQVYGLSTSGSGAFEFSSPNYQVTADGIVAPVTILRVGGTSGPNSDGTGNIYVNFQTVTNTGTALPNVDYGPLNTNVAFPPGAVLETVNVHVFPDSAATGNLNLGLLLTNATSPAIITNQPTALLTILNVNNSVNFSSAFTNIFENVPGGIANISVVRQGSTNGACSVDFYTTTNGSGIPNVDYFPTNETITFNPGVAEQDAQVLIISNSTILKTVGMVLTNPVDTALLVPTNETMTIINNSSSVGQLCFAATNYTVNESAGTVTVYVTRTNGFAGSVSYGYTTVGGTAQPNINFQPTNGTVTFNASVTTQPITVPLLQFSPPENPVTFSVVLTNTTATAATLIAPTNTTVTIVDDISTGVSFVNGTNYLQETNGQVSVFVQRVGATNAYFSIPYVMTNGTALAGTNYVSNTGPLTFAPGETLAGISVTLMNQENVSNLFFGISLLPSNSIDLLAPSNALVVITPAAAGITFTSPTNSVYKNIGTVSIPVVCLDPSNEPPILNSNSIPLSVAFSTTNGTAQAGVDYIATNGILTFTNGIITNTIVVPILNNSQITGQRAFGVTLAGVMPVPPGKLVTPTNEVITIVDANSGLEFSSPNYPVDSGGVVPITVLRVDNTNIVSTVDYATTSGGSAIGGIDYIPTNGILTFAAGQISNVFYVTVIGSSAVEPDKTILMTLSNPTNGILTAPSAATLTIFNQSGSFIVPAGVSLPAAGGGPPGGILQSSLEATNNFAFRDAGGLDVSSMTATMLTNANIQTPGIETVGYGPMTVNGHSLSEPFAFTPIGTNGQTVAANFKLVVSSGSGTNNTVTIETNSFSLTIGSWTTIWYNTNPIVFTGTTNSSPVIASPYPSIITVTNVGGVLVGATVTLTNYSDTAPPANEVMVVAPNLSDTLLMSGVGSSQQRATSVTLTFSNCVPANPLPYSVYPAPAVTITNGVYNPTQIGITFFP